MLQTVLVTVGTTEFDELVEVLEKESDSFVQMLSAQGMVRLVLQVGRGTTEPVLLAAACDKHSVTFEWFRFKPTLHQYMESADLILSHSGAGSIIEALTLKKRIVVIVNDSLQDNHQTELATALESRKYCHATTPKDLCQKMTVLLMDTDYLHNFKCLYPEVNYDLFPRELDDIFS